MNSPILKNLFAWFMRFEPIAKVVNKIGDVRKSLLGKLLPKKNGKAGDAQ